jgi:hypothetical protein
VSYFSTRPLLLSLSGFDRQAGEIETPFRSAHGEDQNFRLRWQLKRLHDLLTVAAVPGRAVSSPRRMIPAATPTPTT